MEIPIIDLVAKKRAVRSMHRGREGDAGGTPWSMLRRRISLVKPYRSRRM